MHVTSRQNPNWVWGSFEHEMNPGWCDYIGCYDSFGAQAAAVPPNRTAVNTQYVACSKTAQLEALMTKANLSPMWRHYCLKSTQVNSRRRMGLRTRRVMCDRGNRRERDGGGLVVHLVSRLRIVWATGAPTATATAIPPFNPTGKPIQDVLNGSRTFSFNRGVLLAPK